MDSQESGLNSKTNYNFPIIATELTTALLESEVRRESLRDVKNSQPHKPLGKSAKLKKNFLILQQKHRYLKELSQ